MSPSPSLTDPDEQITRIRFFARKFRSGSAVGVGDQGSGQRVSTEHGREARPRQFAVAAAARQPFSPDPHDLVVIPAQPLAVSREAIVGAVPPDHSRQMGVLLAERTVQVSSGTIDHGSQGARIPVFRRDLAHHVLAPQRLAPHVGKAKEVEGRPRCRGVKPLRAFEPEVHEARLGRMEREPEPSKALAEHGEQALAGRSVLAGHHRVISIANQLASAFQPRARHRLEPVIQHVVQVDIREQWRKHAPNAKGNFGRQSAICRLRAARFRSAAFSGATGSSAGS